MPESAGPVSGASNQERKGPSRGRIGEAANGYVPLAPRGVGLLNAESSWFNATSYPHNPHIHELGFVILFTRGAFGWMPLARSVYPQAPGTLVACLVLGCGARLRSRFHHGQRAGFPRKWCATLCLEYNQHFRPFTGLRGAFKVLRNPFDEPRFE
jgi:hypothetical protein